MKKPALDPADLALERARQLKAAQLSRGGGDGPPDAQLLKKWLLYEPANQGFGRLCLHGRRPDVIGRSGVSVGRRLPRFFDAKLQISKV